MSDGDAAPIEASEHESRHEAIRENLTQEIYPVQTRDLFVPPLALVLVALPACAAAIGLHRIDWFKSIFTVLSPVLITVGGALYVHHSSTPGRNDVPVETIYPDDQTSVNWPWTFPPSRELTDREKFQELTGDNIDILLTEYEQISEEVRYRDRLLNRTTYFGLAIVGLVTTALVRAPLSQKPAILLIISATSLTFTIALVKYKDARDIHWKRQRDLERLVPEFKNKLTVFHSNRSPERRSLDKWFSLTSSMINLFKTLCALSTIGYMVLVTGLPYVFT